MSAPRPRCSVYIAVSVDGYIARADDGLDWLGIVESPGEDYGYKDFITTIDVLVMGRRTYETALGFPAWPYEGKRVVVMTRSPAARTAEHGVELTAEPPATLVERLAKEGARRLYVDGGGVVHSFLEARLVDDLTLSVIPILLGDGIPLFRGGLSERRLVLDGATSFPTGLVQLRYRARGT